jgi:Reverse transcriptase (RNA-dependent DNA polymerase)
VLGEYFNCKRGVRQGDSLSPFLFYLVSDVLHRILFNAQQNSYIKGVVIDRANIQIMNLHFADDTLLFLEASESVIHALRWMLIGFENLSGMKINFSKCEMIPLNLNENEGHQLASIFGCRIGSLPLTYLGIPLHWKTLTVSDWQFLIDKIEHKLQGWKRKLLSMGGKITLLNSVITSIPIYWMSFYKLPNKVKHRIDQLRRRFLWYGGSSVRKKISLVSWKIICKSKDQGSLGMLDLDVLNKTLLTRWLVRLKDPSIQGLWKNILLIKYSDLAPQIISSPFYRKIYSYKDILDVSINWKVNNGKSTLFWLDRWKDEYSLATKYPLLFSISSNFNITVFQAFSSGQLQLSFNRQLVGLHFREWSELNSEFRNFVLNVYDNDIFLWR